VEESATLTAEQRQLLQAVYDWFQRHGTWPTFGQIDRPLRKAGLDPVAVIKSTAHSLLPPFQAGRSAPQPNDVIHLTIQGIAACDGGGEDVDRFVRLLPWLAQRELDFEPGAGPGEDNLQVASGEFKEFLGLPEDPGTSLSRLYEILNLERWGWNGSAINPETGEWHVGVSREVGRFAGVRTLADYVSILTQRAEEERAPYPITHAAPTWNDLAGLTNGEPATGDTYVAASVIQFLEDKAAQSTWNCDKLLQLIRELNDNHASKNTYATHALLRAILDHVPPILRCTSFNEVTSSYKWGRTDKGYIKSLLAFRLQGDDALHRPISEHADVLRFEDVPPGTWLNRLLHECAQRL